MARSILQARAEATHTGSPPAGFAKGSIRQEEMLRMDAYRAATAFVKGEISVRGGLFAAIRFFARHNRPGWRAWAKWGGGLAGPAGGPRTPGEPLSSRARYRLSLTTAPSSYQL